MQTSYYPPEFQKDAFHCAHCNVYSKQYWYAGYQGAHTHMPEVKISSCVHCQKNSIWVYQKLIYPEVNTIPKPHIDMPSLIIEDYNEASSIAMKSPRGAAALLRLALQKLMKDLGEGGKNINTDIASLVKKGLPVQVQQALDILRVVGNDAVHPGELDIKDDIETVMQLFELINFIIDDQITRKKKINSLYSLLPAGKRKGIEDRDK
jgi:Domain of unknown function (DUF4145)